MWNRASTGAGLACPYMSCDVTDVRVGRALVEPCVHRGMAGLVCCDVGADSYLLGTEKVRLGTDWCLLGNKEGYKEGQLGADRHLL